MLGHPEYKIVSRYFFLFQLLSAPMVCAGTMKTSSALPLTSNFEMCSPSVVHSTSGGEGTVTGAHGVKKLTTRAKPVLSAAESSVDQLEPEIRRKCSDLIFKAKEHFLANRSREGVHALRQAQQLAEKQGLKAELTEIYSLLLEHAGKRGEVKKAIRYQELLLREKETVFSAEFLRGLARQLTTLEEEKYRRAMDFQQESIALQKKTISRNMQMLMGVVVLILLLIITIGLRIKSLKITRTVNMMLEKAVIERRAALETVRSGSIKNRNVHIRRLTWAQRRLRRLKKKVSSVKRAPLEGRDLSRQIEQDLETISELLFRLKGGGELRSQESKEV